MLQAGDAGEQATKAVAPAGTVAEASRPSRPPIPASPSAPAPETAAAPGALVPESPHLLIPPANITIVTTAEELQEATIAGAQDIEIRSHLDLRTLKRVPTPLIDGPETHDNRKRLALLYASPPLRSIRVRPRADREGFHTALKTAAGSHDQCNGRGALTGRSVLHSDHLCHTLHVRNMFTVRTPVQVCSQRRMLAHIISSTYTCIATYICIYIRVVLSALQAWSIGRRVVH